MSVFQTPPFDGLVFILSIKSVEALEVPCPESRSTEHLYLHRVLKTAMDWSPCSLLVVIFGAEKLLSHLTLIDI